jgi:flagellar biosynthetic protein FlhB
MPFSREVGSFLILLVLTLFVMSVMPWIMGKTQMSLGVYIHSPDIIPMDSGSLMRVMAGLLKEVGLLMAIIFIGTIAAGVFATVAQNGFHASTESITPKFEKISLIKGFKRLFSLKSFVEFLKGVIKISVIGFIAFKMLQPHLVGLELLPTFELEDLLSFLMVVVVRLLMWSCILMFVIGAVDILYQRFEFFKGLKMSREELKKEYKETQGDPTIKAKLRQLRQERARKRMMTNVPKADVVITNPEHFAVALEYKENMIAPVVVAKGMDLVALKIREIATANNIPIVQNPPLARALHAAVDLEEAIPAEHYQAVAEVISYVMGMKRPKTGSARF